MEHQLGIFLAFIALFSWGFGDFFIQKTTRLIGSWKSLFFISLVGSVGLLPFVKNELIFLSWNDLYFLFIVGFITITATFLDLEALRKGKIAVIEPVVGLELPMIVILSVVFISEKISFLQFLLIELIFLGILLVITTHRVRCYCRKRVFEKGTLLAILAAIGMALTNLFVGLSSQKISPLITIWLIHILAMIICLGWLLFRGQLRKIIIDFKKYPKKIISQSLLDNLAWVAYASATVFIPIAIVSTITESYVALAVLLGLFINREKIKKHQIVGIILVTVGIIMLAYFS